MSFQPFNLPCGYIQPRTAAARRQRKKYANYPRVVLDKLLTQALKSKKSIQKVCGCLSWAEECGGSGILPERPCRCVEEGYWRLFPVSKAVRLHLLRSEALPVNTRTVAHTHTHTHTHARKEQTHVLAHRLGRLPTNNQRDLCRAVSWYWWVPFSTRWKVKSSTYGATWNHKMLNYVDYFTDLQADIGESIVHLLYISIQPAELEN